MKLKVCGMREAQNVAELAKVAPDYMGVILFRKSSRFVAELPDLSALPRKTKMVGVFVDAPQAEVFHWVEKYQLDMVQLHGKESPEYCEGVRNQVPVIKAFNVSPSFDWAILNAYSGYVDYFLFDAKGDQPGGNGVQFDWTLLKQYPLEIPYFLSGGIGLKDAETIRELTDTRLHAIDVNSGFETAPAVKNIKELVEFQAIINA